MNWFLLESLIDLNQAVEDSNKENIKAVLIFKHSKRCSISHISKFCIEYSWQNDNKFPTYFLDLIKFRELSNQISELFSVRHESPQVLIIKHGKCIYHTSHLSISVKEILAITEN